MYCCVTFDLLGIFESDFDILLLKIFSGITARRAFRFREKLMTNFVKYYEASGPENSSRMTYER